MKFLAHQVWAIWFIVRMWVGDTDMQGALVADEIGLGKTCTSVAAAIICKLLTEKVVIGLLLSILWENTHDERLDLGKNDFPGMIGDKWEWYPLRRYNSMPCHLAKIQSTAMQGHPVRTLASEPILVVPMPGVAERFKSVIDKMTYGTDFKLIHLFQVENANLTH
jgi:hypothetical protein